MNYFKSRPYRKYKNYRKGIFTVRNRHDHIGKANSILRDLFFLTENWRCNYKSTICFNDYMKKPCTGNSHKIVGKKNISIRHRETWRR